MHTSQNADHNLSEQNDEDYHSKLPTHPQQTNYPQTPTEITLRNICKFFGQIK